MLKDKKEIIRRIVNFVLVIAVCAAFWGGFGYFLKRLFNPSYAIMEEMIESCLDRGGEIDWSENVSGCNDGVELFNCSDFTCIRHE